MGVFMHARYSSILLFLVLGCISFFPVANADSLEVRDLHIKLKSVDYLEAVFEIEFDFIGDNKLYPFIGIKMPEISEAYRVFPVKSGHNSFAAYIPRQKNKQDKYISKKLTVLAFYRSQYDNPPFTKDINIKVQWPGIDHVYGLIGNIDGKSDDFSTVRSITIDGNIEEFSQIYKHLIRIGVPIKNIEKYREDNNKTSRAQLIIGSGVAPGAAKLIASAVLSDTNSIRNIMISKRRGPHFSSNDIFIAKIYRRSNEKLDKSVLSSIAGGELSDAEFYELINHEGESKKQEKRHNEIHDIAKAKEISDFRQVFFRQDNHGNIDSIAPKSKSWQRTEVTRHKNSIANSSYDYIVLPVQESNPFNDRVGRLMSSRWIANEIERQTGKMVMSPELAQRLLDDHALRFEDQQVTNLAKRVGADVIHLYLEGTPPTETRLAVVITRADGFIKRYSVRKLGVVTPKKPLEMLVAEATDGIVAELFNVSKKHPAKKVYHVDKSWTLPDKIDQLPDIADSPLIHSAYLQLVALLTPKVLDYERRRLFERSLLALRNVDPSSDYYNLLTARALVHLYRRPAAISYLSSASLPAELALREYLNGNYPELRKLIPKIESPLLKASAYIDLDELHYAYNKSPDDLILFENKSPAWQALIISSEKDSDPWYAPDNLEFFYKIKGLFPDYDHLFEEVLKEKAFSGDLELYTENADLFETIFQRANVSHDTTACCLSYKENIEGTDIWMLYRNIAIANLFRKLDLMINVQALIESAQDLSERLEARFEGYPAFMRLYAQVLVKAASQKHGSEKEYLLKKAYDYALDASIHSAGSDVDSILANGIWSELYQLIPHDNNEVNPVSVRRLYNDWPSKILEDEMLGFHRALPFTITELRCAFMPASAPASRLGISREELEDEFKKRFNGHPDKASLMAKKLIKNNQTDGAIALLRNEIQAGNDSWNTYNDLGNLLVDEGRIEEASKVFLSYPNFNNVPSGKKVEVSNHAYDVATTFFWLGHYEEAREFYEISASLDTGAGSQLGANKRLAMMAGDFRTVMEYAYRGGRRYNDHYDYRDYLTFLELFGFHDEAESAFKALAPRYELPDLWESAFVGQRVQEKSLDKIAQWTKDYLSEAGAENLRPQAQRYILMQSIVDRKPTSNQVAILKDFKLKDLSPSKPGRNIFYDASSKKKLKNINLSSIFSDRYLQDSGEEIPRQVRTQSCLSHTSPYADDEYPGFLDAYTKLRSEQYEDALSSFLILNKNFCIMGVNREAGYALPYVAIAASHSPASVEFPQFLSTLKSIFAGSDFDNELAQAIVYAHLGELDNAFASFKKAEFNLPHKFWRPYSAWYQLTEIAEWLYKDTNDERFIIRAVELAKRYQVIQPQFAWAYAFEAKYSKVEQDRIRAAGFASHLDPQSA
jgi:hypothetical protein